MEKHWVHRGMWINCLTPSTSAFEHTSNFPCVWVCTIFSVASYLHHYLASNCTSLLTLKCLKSNFKLEDIFKFSENNRFFFFTLNIPAQGCPESNHASPGLYTLHFYCKQTGYLGKCLAQSDTSRSIPHLTVSTLALTETYSTNSFNAQKLTQKCFTLFPFFNFLFTSPHVHHCTPFC